MLARRLLGMFRCHNECATNDQWAYIKAVGMTLSVKNARRASVRIGDNPTKESAMPNQPNTTGTPPSPNASFWDKYRVFLICALVALFVVGASLCRGNYNGHQPPATKGLQKPDLMLDWAKITSESKHSPTSSVGASSYCSPSSQFDVYSSPAKQTQSQGTSATSRITAKSFASTLYLSTTPPIPSTDYSRYYDPTYRPAVGEHYVNGYFRLDGTYVHGHYRTNPDNSFYNNWSTKGNVNPYTGKVGTKEPTFSSHKRR
jgi:hypothetical protein